IDPKKLRTEIVGDVLGALDKRDKQRLQADVDRRYAAEANSVKTKFMAFIAKRKVPNQMALDGLAYAERYITRNELGGPTRKAELAAGYIQREMSDLAVKAKQKLATVAAEAADDKKVKAAEVITQPAGAGISAPSPGTPEAMNDALADALVKDDVFD
ncbi:hypothetical protein LCGC14_2445770, partial [marine sediment metagenome]